MDVHIYHNPRCSKSRQALDLLRENGVEPTIIEYLKTPPEPREIDRILCMLDADARDLMRTGEPEYGQMGLDRKEITREQLIQALHDHPKLLQRPIVVTADKAVIGRPPEKVLEILG